MKRIKHLPSNAVFDYKDICGRDIYHTENRRYIVNESRNFGKTEKVIYSLTHSEFEREC